MKLGLCCLSGPMLFLEMKTSLDERKNCRNVGTWFSVLLFSRPSVVRPARLLRRSPSAVIRTLSVNDDIIMICHGPDFHSGTLR